MNHENTNARKELPAGWRWARLGEVCKFLSGGTPSKGDAGFWLGDIPWISPKDMKIERIQDSIDHISVMAIDSGATRIVEAGGILCVTRSGILAHTLPVALTLRSVAFNQDIRALVPDESHVDSNYLIYALKSAEETILTEGVKKGPTVHSLKSGFLENFHIPLPPLATQRAIARRLERDMAEVARLRAAAERQRQAAAALPPAYLREIFEGVEGRGWPVMRLGDASNIGSGVTLGKTFFGVHIRSVPYLRVANVKDGYLDLSNVYNIEVPERDIEKCRLQFGDLLLTEGGDPDKLGRGTFWENQLPECIHQNHIFRVRFDLNQFSPQFIAYQLQSSYGKAYFLTHAKQTTGIATINQQVLANFPLMTPTFAEQQALIHRLNDDMAGAANLRNAVDRQRQAIEAMPAALLREVFGGFNDQAR